MRATREDADHVARLLKETCPAIRGIELFGSTLSKGHGHDIDLVLIVDEEVARAWWRDSAEELRVRMYTSLLPFRRFVKTVFPFLDVLFLHGRKARKQARASELLGIDIAKLSDAYKPGIIVEVFLLPENWRNGPTAKIGSLSRLADVIKHSWKTRSFLAHIAKQAVRIV